jgi:hypothetical protein
MIHTTDHTPELCLQCEGTGYHLMQVRSLIALKQVKIMMPNANTIIMGVPAPDCPCDCHRSPIVV